MKRPAIALIALLAVLALSAAAATLQTAQESEISLSGSGDLDEQSSSSAPGEAESAGGSGEEVGEQADSGSSDSASSGGGTSSLLVAAFVTALMASAALIVLLTGDDERASPPDEESEDEPSPTPSVNPEYASPSDAPLFRAWEQVASRANADESETPTETAREAVLRGLPDDAVEDLRRAFRAARYGRDDPRDHRRTADEALERFDERGERQ